MKEVQNILYSIIIPHRNSYELLVRLVNSIPLRNDIQIIIADNSTHTIEFKSILEGNLNVEVCYSDIHKGAGHARNIGLQKAKGKWILFADADDFFTNLAFDLFDKHVKADNDLIYFGVESKDSNTYEPAERSKFYDSLVNKYHLSKGEKEENLLRLKHVVPWGKLISFDLINENQIKFDEVPASNDVMFATKLGLLAKKIQVDTGVVYCVTVTQNSLTQKTTKERNLSRFKVGINYNKLLKEKGYEEYQISLMVYVVKSLSFGLMETLKFFKIAKSNNVNIISLWLASKKKNN